MAQFRNELTLDARLHNQLMRDAATSVRNYDRQIRSAERSTALLIVAQLRQLRETQRMRREMLLLSSAMTNAFSSNLGVNLGALTSKMNIAIAGAASFGAALKYNIETAAEFEESMSRLSSLTGAIGEDLDYLKKAAIELGSTTTQSAKQVAESFGIIGSKAPELLKNKEALVETTLAAITLAEAANMSVDEAATALTGVLNQFELSSSRAREVINLLAAASKEGAGDINYLNSAIVKCGAVASSMGISVDKVVAILEQLAQGGLDASSAGNNLKNIFLALETSADSNLRPSVVGITTALKNLKARGLSAAEMVKLFGKENIAAATIILNTTEKIDEMVKAIQGTNTAEEQAKTNTNNLNGSLKNLSSAWEGLNLTINDSSGALKVFIDWCTSALNAVKDLLTQMDNVRKARRELMNGGDGSGKYSYVPVKWQGLDINMGGTLEELKDRLRKSSKGKGQQAMYEEGMRIIEAEILKYDKYTKSYHHASLRSARLQAYQMKKDWADFYKNEILNPVLKPPTTPPASTPPSTNGSGGSSSRVDAVKKEKTEWEKLKEIIDLVEKDGEKKLQGGTLADALTIINKNQDNGIYGRNEIAALLAHDQEYLNKLKSTLTDIGNLDTSKMTREQVLYLRKAIEYLNIEIEKYSLYTEAQKAQEASTKHWSDTVKKYYKALDDAQQKLGDKDGLLKDLENERWKIYLEFGLKIDDALTEKDLQDLILLLMGIDPKFAEALLKNYLKLAATLKTTQTAFKDFDYETLSTVFSGNDEALSQIEAVHNFITSINKNLDGTQTIINSIRDSLAIATGYVEKWHGISNTFEGLAGAIGAASNAISSFGARSKALIGIMGALNVAQAIAALVGSYAKAMAENKSFSIWDWIAGGLAGVAALGAMISQLKSLNTYSTGGIVEGGTSVGDYNLARLNSGEMVLNAGQLAHLWNLVNGGSTRNNSTFDGGKVEFVIKGKNLVGTLNNYNKQQSRI